MADFDAGRAPARPLAHPLLNGVSQMLLPAVLLLAQQAIAFTHVTVIPMDRERTLADYTVVVRGQKIVEVGPSGRVKVPAEAKQIDGRGKYLMPGLAEMHAHIPPGKATDAEIEKVLAYYALNGLTTVRGMLGAPR
jgi:imidazolonepropionase-like amidohydrolase